MIRTEREYRHALERLDGEATRLETQRKELRRAGLSASEIKRVLDPMRSFHQQSIEEVRTYERLKEGQFDEMRNLEGLGRLLIGLRIASGTSQRALADTLGVHESQVSRDERHEYAGLTVERATRILEALGIELRTIVDVHDRDSAP